MFQVPYPGVIRDLSRAIHKSSVGNPTSSSLVKFKGKSCAHARILRLTLSKRDEQEYALRANEDIEMYEVGDDEEEEEAVMDELDGNKMTMSFM